MSAFPVASNIAHAKRYGRALGLRQVSEPNGALIHSRPLSPTPHRRHRSSGSPPRCEKLRAPSPFGQQLRQVQSSFVQMNAKLNSEHKEENPHGSFVPLKRSNSVDRFIRNVLPSAVAGLNNAFMPPINIRNTVKNDLQMAGEKKHDSGFGSGANIGSYGLGLGQIASGFFRAQTDSIIDALNNFTPNAGQISA
ncbi:hypothetical protein Ddc_03745 [Ditylenchus destructor]|nr:hypothetical protein Ddc_03745 [Ditylenchus destructor]